MSASQNIRQSTAFQLGIISSGHGKLALSLMLLSACLFAVTGCQTTKPTASSSPDKFAASAHSEPAPHTESITLREGDVLKISFLGARNMDVTQTIRRDGNINFSLIGDVKAAGKTLSQLQDDLLKAYAGQIDSKIINVEVVSSSFPVFVTGAVTHAQKVMSDHPITALEAIMEAGGPDYSKANLKHVKISRQESGGLKSYDVNLKAVLDGASNEQFFLKPSDIIYVPEKFNWF